MKIITTFIISFLVCLSVCDIIYIDDVTQRTTTTTSKRPRYIQPCPYSDSWRNQGCNGCKGDPCRFDKECCFGMCNYVTASCYGPNRTHGTPYPVNPNTSPRIF